MSLRLILARHGQTPSNVDHVLDSAPPGPPLTQLGSAQASALARRLEHDGTIAAVHASTAVRAQQTAAPLAAALGLDVQVTEGVHEVFCGDLEGRSDVAARQDFDAVSRAWYAGDLAARLPGGESALDVRERFLPTVERITAAATGSVVLVSHGAAIRMAASALLDAPPKYPFLVNTGLVILERTPDGWALEHWDEDLPPAGDVTAGAPAE